MALSLSACMKMKIRSAEGEAYLIDSKMVLNLPDNAATPARAEDTQGGSQIYMDLGCWRRVAVL